MAATIGYATLWNVVNRADRNRNGRLEASDAYVLGNAPAKAGNPTVADTFQALWSGQAGLDGVRMSQADADAAAAELTGGRDVLDENVVGVSRAAKQAMDGVGGEAFDGKVSRRELSVALQWGALAVTRDGLALSQEARDYFDRRPATQTPALAPDQIPPAPPVVPAPTQQIPAPPPVPQAPQTPRAPAAPGQAVSTHPYTVFQNYYAAREALLTRWNGRSDADGFKREERPLLERACNEIFTSRVGTYEERKAALQRVYQYSKMTYDEYNRLDKQLAQYAGMRR